MNLHLAANLKAKTEEQLMEFCVSMLSLERRASSQRDKVNYYSDAVAVLREWERRHGIEEATRRWGEAKAAVVEER